MDLKSWNKDIKSLREIILKPDKYEESVTLMLGLHSMVHSSIVSDLDKKTFEDELWEGLDEETFRSATNEKGRTIAYGLWHSSRIEDITMNMLVAEDEQVFNTGDWKRRINSSITDTGNSLTESEILEFSKSINMNELKDYRVEVGKKTRAIIKNLIPADMKRRFDKSRLKRIIDEGAVLDVDASNWLVSFWGRKNVSGIILMPATRHHVVHINESLSARKRAGKSRL